ncbi:MAG: aldo/keto reductase, partial [Symbiobacteriaceae bacterium]|nr:aldo/keto reductase [Symbiobacteriaceae bacterium]
TRDKIGRAMAGLRDKLIIQGHIGLTLVDGQEARTQELQPAREHMEDLMTRLNTDYIDIAMLHCVDSVEEYLAAEQSGLIAYMLEQKAKGVFKYLGFASHNPDTATALVKTGHFQVVMFSINPLFDLLLNDMQHWFTMPDDEAYPTELNIDTRRAAFYALCAERGIGINAMKVLAAGTLVNPAGCPFSPALNVLQCIHYTLNRPAVGSAIIGFKKTEELTDALRYFQVSPEELDYTQSLHSVTGEVGPQCMYCNHCLPCTAHIDIARVTKTMDALIRDKTSISADECHDLAVMAASCIACGQCASRCPFAVDVTANMKKAAQLLADV